MAFQPLDVSFIKAVSDYDLASEALQLGLPLDQVRLLVQAVRVENQFSGHSLRAVGGKRTGTGGNDGAVGQGEAAGNWIA